MKHITKVVPDTSVIIEGIVSKAMESGELNPQAIIIHNAVVDELEHQANRGHETGYLGLEEIYRITALCRKRDIVIEFKGPQPGQFEIDHAKDGAIDDMIRSLAVQEHATLLTADRVQNLVAQATSIPVHYIQFDVATKEGTVLDEFFTPETMSAHLKEDAQSVAKMGKPGTWSFRKIERILTRGDMQFIAKSIVEQAGSRKDSYIEAERKGSTIVQLGKYRIVIAKPPFASQWEITAVRPVKQLTLDEYQLSEKLTQRLAEHAEGVLIAGAPGEGKSTFVQALATFYNNKNKIVKTLEAPRDLIVPKEITQYSLGHASSEEVRDVLLLNRPDYTVFDEMRNTGHFQLYADLRLSGVGMVGVMHATKAIDAIQRFIGRIELGVIPHVVDTVIFIKAGNVQKVFSVDMKVKVPSGMTEADLARPVVCIYDFETGKQEFEVYTYGEETIVIPVDENSVESPALKLASQAIKEYFYQYADHVSVEMPTANKAIVYVPKEKIASIIGQGGKNIQGIEKDLGIGIDIRDRSEKGERKPRKEEREELTIAPGGKSVQHEIIFNKKEIIIEIGKRLANKDVDFYDANKHLLSATVNKKGEIRMSRESGQGQSVLHAVKHGKLVVYEG